MKRSKINAIIKRFEELLREYRFALPPYLSFTPEEWVTKGHEYDEIRDNMLGWDVTDYGLGEYERTGLALITIRNGNVHDERYKKPYAEKIMMLMDGQVSPNHFHWSKMEDIINRGGGKIVFKLWNATKKGQLADTNVEINKDGCKYMIPAGTEVTLAPGESLSLYPYYYHEFSIQGGDALVGEVSMCNDDNTDNHFLDIPERFPVIEEDEVPYRLLCNEYPAAQD